MDVFISLCFVLHKWCSFYTSLDGVTFSKIAHHNMSFYNAHCEIELKCSIINTLVQNILEKLKEAVQRVASDTSGKT